MESSRTVYIISDLHIGGAYAKSRSVEQEEAPTASSPEASGKDRGFRMCTRVDALQRFVEHIAPERKPGDARVELVINGDFVDFLAEEAERRDPLASGRAAQPRTWKPLITSPAEAVDKLGDIVRRDRQLFDALGKLLARGHALTLLLGNHDVELSYPAVQEALTRHLGVNRDSAFKFILEEETYLVGDAHIEHGNHYDGFNRIDHARLKQARTLQGAAKSTDDGPFEPPPGSRLVAYLMNPMKETYPFVDLLKPEAESVLPILAALAPSVRWKLPYLLWLKAKAALRRDAAAEDEGEDQPRGADVAGEDDDAPRPKRTRRPKKLPRRAQEEERLRALLAGRMTEEGAAEFLRKLADGETAPQDDDDNEQLRGLDIASPSPHVLRLLASVDPRGLRARLPALLDALRIVQKDRSFDEGCETEKDYLDAAQTVARAGRRFVIFGHTHLAKRVDLEGGATYFNTGTWADLIVFPKKIFQPNDVEAMAELAIFVDDLERGELAKHIHFKPTYVRLDVKGDRVERAELGHWKG